MVISFGKAQGVLGSHSVKLDAYDLKAVTVLRGDTGKSYLLQKSKADGKGD